MTRTKSKAATANPPETPPLPGLNEAPSNALIAHLAAAGAPYAIQVLAQLYSDGSLTYHGHQAYEIERLREDCVDDDKHEHDPGHWTRIVRVRIEILEHVETPSAAKAGQTCPTCGHVHTKT